MHRNAIKTCIIYKWQFSFILPSGLDDFSCNVIVGEGLRRFGVSVLFVTDVEEKGTAVTVSMSNEKHKIYWNEKKVYF